MALPPHSSNTIFNKEDITMKNTITRICVSKKLRRLVAVLLTVTMFTAMFSPSAFAASKSGKCGKNVTWKYNSSSQVLTISGTGPMYSYNNKETPWDRANFDDRIKTITIAEGVTKIGTDAFEDCDRITKVQLPDSLTQINRGAFEECGRLTSITIPENVSVIGQQAFAECDRLSKVVFTGSAPSIASKVFEDVTATVTYPAGDDTWSASVRKNYGGRLTWKDSNGKSPSSSTSKPSNNNRISRDQAKKIAFKHAGVSASDVYDLEVELDREHGKWIYEVSFETDEMEYEYEINASNGKILHWEQDYND